MKKTTRFTALLLVVVMLVQTFAFAAQISDFGDFPKNSWSTEAVTAAVENGLLIGRGNNKLDPKGLLTRAEMAAIMTRAFGATVEKDISSFEDVKDDEWYYPVVAKAYNMLVMQGTGDNTFSPKNNTSREEVFLSLARVLHIDSEEYSVLDKFSDKADIADWSKNALTGMVGDEYLNGYKDGTLRPKGKITREELAQVFHNIFKTYISEPGTYSSVAHAGSVIIRSPGVTLENVTINGDLVLADGIGAGDCRINNVTVNGRIIVRGGEGTVYFVNVKSTGKVIINDVNGTVNFHNYRTDVPFKDNLIENTPATFLKPTGGGFGGGPGGGGAITHYITFKKVDGTNAGAPVGVKNNSTIKNTSGASVPAENTLGIPDGHSFYGWGVSGDTIANIIANHNVKTSDEVANMVVTGAHTFVPLYVENATGIIKGGSFGENSDYHVNHDDHDVTADGLMDEYSTDTTYPKEWTVTDYSKPEGDPDRTKVFDDVDDLVDFINNLPPDTIVKVEVTDTNNKIAVEFYRLDKQSSDTTVYADWKNKLLADKWPAKKNELVQEGGIWYFYEQTGWAFENGTEVKPEDDTIFSTNPTKIFAVYNKSVAGIIVKYFHDKNGDGQFDEADGSDELFALQNYYEENIQTHNLTKSEYPSPAPSKEGNFAFAGWTTDPAKALDFENAEIIADPYTLDIANSPISLYASFISTVVNAEFTDDDTYGSDNNQDTSVKVEYNTGAIIGNIPTFELKDEYKEKYYFFGWVDTANNNKQVSASEIEAYMKERAMTDKADMFFTALYLEKTVVTFYDLLGNKFGDEVYYKPDENVAKNANVPSLGNYEELYYFVGWSKTQGITDAVPEDNRLFKFEEAAGTEDIELYPALGMRYEVVFSFVDPAKAPTTATKNAYAIPGDKLEASRIPTALGFTYNGYVYTFANWTLSGTDTDGDGVIDAGAAFDFANTDIVPPTTYVFSAVYTKELADVVVTFIYGCDADGNEETGDNGNDIETVPNKSLGDEVGLPTYTPSKKATHQYTYTFAGWALSENADESDIVISEDGTKTYIVALGDIVVENEVNTIKLYPVYTSEDVEYKVILTVETPSDFRAKDGEGYKEWTDVVKTTIYGGSVTLPGASSDEIPVRPGTNFKYWYTADKTPINVTELKVEPALPTDGTLPETTITLYAYMECEVKFVDEVGKQEKTIAVQYNTVIDENEIPDWAKTEYGFERNAAIADEYADLNYVHEIEHDWFNLEDFGEWEENEWAVKPTKWVEFDEKLPVKSHDTVELSTRRINLEAFIDIEKVQNLLDGPVKLTVPYEVDEENPEEGRFLTTVKDAIFMNETFVLNAYNQSGAEDKLFDKLRNKNLMAFGSKEILNINKFIRLVQVMGEKNLNKFIDEQLKKYFESDEAAQTLNEFLTKYLTNVNASNEQQVAEKLGELVNGMLANDKDGTILVLESAAHNVAENDLTALSDVIKAYIDTSLETEAGTTELKTLLNEAFIKYCNEHEDDFRDFLETIVEDLLIVHPDPSMIDLVTVLAIDKVKAGEFKAEIKAEIEKMADEDLQALIVNFVENDFAFVESGISAALDDENFVISMVELLADDGTFKTTIKTLAEQTLATGGDDLKNKLKEMFLNDLTEDQKKNLIDSYVTNLEDPAKIRELAITHINEISNEEILSYVQGENPLIDIEASKLRTYINLYQDQIPNSTILAKVKEENSPIKVPSDTLLSLVKNGTISIPEATVLALVKTELLGMMDSQIASYIKDGTIPVADSFIAGIITDAINAERDSLIADAKNQAYDEIYEELILNGIPQDVAEEEAAQKVEEKAAEIEAKVDEEIAKKIADETTPAKIAEAKANITEEQVADYRTDIDSQINSIEYSAIESYANDYIQNKLTAQDIENNYATLVAQLDETTFATMKANVLSALDEATVEANKTAFLSLVTADIVGNIKLTIINDATDAEILKIKASIADILKEDDGIQQAVIDAYLDEAFASDDLGDNLDTLLADTAGRHLIAVVVADHVESNPDAKNTLVTEVIKTLKSDIEANGTMIDTAIGAYLSDPDRKAELITKAVNMLSTKDSNDKYILDDKNGLVYKEIYDAVQAIITDENRCAPIIDAYVGSVIDVEDGEEVDFTEIIDIFCEGKKEFRDGVIDRFIENLNTLPDTDGNGIGDGVEIVEEMIDAILEKMGNAGHVDEEIILVVLDYIVKHHEDEHGQELIQMLVQTIVKMDNILEFAKELGYDSVNENLAEVDKFKEELCKNEQFQINKNNVFIMGPLKDMVESLEFDNVVETYLKSRLPEKIYNKIPFELVAKPIYERSRMDFYTQLTDAIAVAEAGGVGYVNSGVTINFNPIHEVYVPIYEYALEQYEKACEVADNNTGKPGKAYDRYLKENPYVDDLIELLNPEKLFNEVSSDHSYELEGSGYAIKDFADYYQLVKSAAVLMDDMFLWYLDVVDYADVEKVLLKAEERVLGYTNLLVSLANSYANDGIPDDISDIYDDILANALASGDFEKVVGKVEGITNKDVEYYIDRVLESRYPELAYDKALGKVGARAATILELYIDSKFNRYVTDKDYGRILELLEFAYEDLNNNVTVDYVMDKVMDSDDKRELEFRGNTVTVTRTVAATNDND